MKTLAYCALSIGAAAALLVGCALRQAQDDMQLPIGVTGGASQFGAPSGGTQACPRAGPDVGRCSVQIAGSEARVAPGTVTGWAPADFQAAYKLPVSRGTGQIVALVSAYDYPDTASDLSTYRTEFGLGTAKLFKYNQDGEQSNYPTSCLADNEYWLFYCLADDIGPQMVSASCPNCTIYLVEANSETPSDLEAATQEAVALQAHIVTILWGCLNPPCVPHKYFDKPGVLYLGAACSRCSGPQEPSSFDKVASIGATQLARSGSGYSETPWSGDIGGCAIGVKKPKWQSVIPNSRCVWRTANDAAAAGGCQPGAAIYSTAEYGWVQMCGTSLPTALLAGVFGLAGNAAQQTGGKTFWLKAHHKDLNRIAGTCTYGYTQGRYTTCAGWGSPKGIGAF